MSWVGKHVVESCVHRQAGGGLTPDHVVLDACTSREPKGWHQVSSFSRDFSGAGCGGGLCVSSAGRGIIVKHVLVMGCPRAKRNFFPNAVAPWSRLADAIRCLPPSPGSGPGACRPLYCSSENWLVDSWARAEMRVARQGDRSRFRQVFRFVFQILAIVVQA